MSAYEDSRKLGNFQTFWQSIPKKQKGLHRRRLLLMLRLSDYSFYTKLRNNAFLAHERAVISAYFNRPQKDLFPDFPVIFQNVNINQLQKSNSKIFDR